jgi:hypothetical protein
MNYVGQQESDPLTLVLYPCEGNGASTLYEDEGDGYEYLNGFYGRRAITCEGEAGNIRVAIGEREGAFVPARKHIRLELLEIGSEPKAVQAGEASTWRYDPEQRRLMVELPETASLRVLNVSME